MSNGTTLPAPIGGFVRAINTANTSAFVALFTSDGVISDWGTEYRGADGIRSWAASDAIGAGARMTVLAATTDGDVTTVRFDWVSRVFTGQSDGIFTIAAGMISSFVIPPA